MMRPIQFSLKHLLAADALAIITGLWRWSHWMVMKTVRDHWRKVYLEGGDVPPTAMEWLFTADEREELQNQRAAKGTK
jgi:hypothetical protein